jgi:cytochrome P450
MADRALTPLTPFSELPGPRGWPVLGNALQIDKRAMHRQAEAWAAAHGLPYRFRIGPRRFLVIGDPELIGRVLRDRPDTFKRTDKLVRVSKEMGFAGLFAANDDSWRRQRTMVLASLDPTHIKAFFPSLQQVTGRLLRRWRRCAEAGQAIDLQADLMRYTVDVTAGLAFGSDINSLESEGEVIQAHLDKILPAFFRRMIAPFEWWHLVKLPGDHALDAHLQALRQAVDGFIAEARGRLEREPGRRLAPVNLIEAMVAARDRPDSGVSDADVSGNVLTMLLAGEDTTANTLAWTLWLLARHPQAAQAAAAEARAVLGEAPVPATLEQLRALDFVEACAHESMRLRPVAPINIVQASRDVTVGEVSVPKGTLVMCLMRPAALDERHFAAAAEFRPQRWLDPSTASAGKRVAMPFGAGPRMCPGRYLALAEIKMVLATVLRNFVIDDLRGPLGEAVEERLSMTMWPLGLKMRLRVG